MFAKHTGKNKYFLLWHSITIQTSEHVNIEIGNEKSAHSGANQNLNTMLRT